jgi:hypothetical protein
VESESDSDGDENTNASAANVGSTSANAEAAATIAAQVCAGGAKRETRRCSQQASLSARSVSVDTGNAESAVNSVMAKLSVEGTAENRLRAVQKNPSLYMKHLNQRLKYKAEQNKKKRNNARTRQAASWRQRAGPGAPQAGCIRFRRRRWLVLAERAKCSHHAACLPACVRGRPSASHSQRRCIGGLLHRHLEHR